MQSKFTEIANKITTIKSDLAEAISAKGVETAPDASFNTMIENIGNITSGENESEIEEWVKPHDWIDIEEEPLEEGEIRVLMCDLFGSDHNAICFTSRYGTTNIKATIDWGDGTTDEINVDSEKTVISHTFVGEGIPCNKGYNQYVTRIRFNEPKSAPTRMYFYRDNATSTNMIHNNLLWIYGDAQYLTNLMNFCGDPFSYGSSILLERVNLINTSNVTNMSSMFYNCYSLKSVPQLDTSNVNNFVNMFYNCYAIEEIPELDTSKGTSAINMFCSCISLKYIPSLDTKNFNSGLSMFSGCHSLKYVPPLDLFKATNTNTMFSNCYSLEEVTLLNTSNVTTMTSMFSNCHSLKSAPQLDTSNVTNMNAMFYGCYNLKKIPPINTSNALSMSNMFFNCYSLKYVPPLDTSNATLMNSMFYNCCNLEEVPELDTSKATNVSSMFYNCKFLKKTPPIDTRKTIGNYSYSTGFLYACSSLEEIGTITLSKDIRLEVGSNLYKMPVLKIDVAYDELDPPVFSETVPIKINYTQLTAESLNKLMYQLPDGNGKTLDLKYNAGSLDCDPNIATAKNWTVLVK